ncbi:MAG: sodium:proton antiporter [Oscillospiraceae bacterium]|nr:sodium:proton antiporter [Oscillospiraceae bacterium]
MSPFLTLGLFMAVLLACILTGAPLLGGLCVGLAVFCVHALRCGHTPAQVWDMLKAGVSKSATILRVLLLIGLVTATWRACGTIPFILYHAVGFINPAIFTLCAFLLCSAMSFLTGTAFGTAGTMGFICMMLGRAAGLPVPLLGGAILAGSYWGDRSSPMSSSALLVASLTETDIYKNLGNMFRSALVPTLLTCLFYLAVGGSSGSGEIDTSCVEVFARNFDLSPVTVVPALLILILACFHVKVIHAMAVSIVVGCFVAVFVQGLDLFSLAKILVLGFAPADPELAALLAGGGIRSMLKVLGIIIVSSASFGIFDATNLLDCIHTPLQKLAGRITDVGATIVASFFLSGLACNQTLATMLVNQVCGGFFPEKEERALMLEDTVIVMAPLIPWSIAGNVPLASVGAPMSGIFYAVYLFILPLWVLLVRAWQKKKTAKAA